MSSGTDSSLLLLVRHSRQIQRHLLGEEWYTAVSSRQLSQVNTSRLCTFSAKWSSNSPPGYDVVRKDRENNGRHGGGVCIYVRSSINFQIRADLSPSDIECLTIEISRPRSKPFLCLLGTDRHSHLLTFSRSLRGLLTKLTLKIWNYIYWVT